MRKTQKILTATLWGLTVFAMMTVIGAGLWKRQRARAATENSLEVLGNVPSFSLVDQDARPFTNQMLAGKPFVVDFIFTNCAGPCPVMTEKMAGLQKEMADPRVQLVTVTVDPERDTPAVLKEYAKEHGA